LGRQALLAARLAASIATRPAEAAVVEPVAVVVDQMRQNPGVPSLRFGSSHQVREEPAGLIGHSQAEETRARHGDGTRTPSAPHRGPRPRFGTAASTEWLAPHPEGLAKTRNGSVPRKACSLGKGCRTRSCGRRGHSSGIPVRPSTRPSNAEGSSGTRRGGQGQPATQRQTGSDADHRPGAHVLDPGSWKQPVYRCDADTVSPGIEMSDNFPKGGQP